MSENKAILTKAMNALFRDFSEEDMRRYYKQDYIQHNPNVPTGLDSIIGLLPVLKESGFDYNTHRMIEDGDLILTHTTYTNAQVFGAETVVAFDIWRMEDGQVSEHWDSIIPHYKETASGRSQIDGMTEIFDLNKTQENKTLVKFFVTEVLIEGDVSKMSSFFKDERYDQHNPVVKDGLEALKNALTEITNDRIHRVIGEGNFVLTQSEGAWKRKPYAIYDLFRVEDGCIVEHWDVLQEIPAEMAHENGMF
ncbi:nuclear transport factor 2 family protein [Calothrix rhizosoleniae]|uniref:nuclear transport factor 2 family protein n=1 Tax=Calothrix rhizosoleniae TaxID=888997 RepID=UPI000B4A384D|nr:nuclear transport factor 2 family protein [Calothrix rhizosoleniae]